MRRSAQNLDFNLRRDHQKISYERRDYDSVDEKNLSWAMSRKTKKKKNSGHKGLKSKIWPNVVPWPPYA